MARVVLVVSFVVLLALLGGLFFTEGDQAPLVAPPAPAQATVPAVAADATATAAVGPLPAPQHEPEPDRANALEHAAADQLPIPADAKWLDVLVFDKATKQPVAGADAVWCDETVYERIAKLSERERETWYRDQERIARRWGWRGRSDRDGKLRVHVGKSWTMVHVRHAGSYGAAHLQAGQEPPKEGHRVLLEPDFAVRVHVVDAAGQPAAGVGLSLEPHDPEQKRARYHGGELRTDAYGMATFVHVQHQRTVPWGPQQGQPVAQWSLFVCIPGLDLPPAVVDAVQVPSEPVEVRLPPTGRLRAKVTLDGQPMPGLRVAFHVGPQGASEARNGAEHALPDPDGWARFPCVPLGKPLFVLADQGAGSFERELPGPTLPGQEVEIAFDLAGEAIVMTGRMLRDDGQPLAEQFVHGNYDATVSMGGTQIRTDAAGRFVWWVGSRQPDRKDAVKLELLAFDWQSEGSAPLRIEVQPRELVVGRNDLGDLRFGVAELVVSGRFAFDSPGGARTWFEVARLDERRRQASTESWRRVDGLQVEVRDDGTFEVRGKLAPGRQRLEVRSQHHLPVEPVEFALGTKDLVIPVRRGNTLQASCLLPDGVPPQWVNLRLQPHDRAVAPKAQDGRRWGRDDPLQAKPQAKTDAATPYAWAALPAGTYTLRVEAGGLAEPYAVVADVVLPQPEGGDPRLLGIDLRPVMTTLRLRVTTHGEASDPRDQPILFLQPQALEQEWRGLQFAIGEAVLPAPKRPIDVMVCMEGCRPVTLRGAVDTAEVTMEPWPTVPVSCLGLDALPSGATLSISARAANAGQRDERRYRTEWRAGSLANLLTPSAGATEVENGVARLQVGDGVHTLSAYLSLEARGQGKLLQQLTPNEIVAGAPVTVQLAVDEVRSAVAALQQQAADAKPAK
ncbi:MAG: hypothetical protein MUC36_27195 [Planctomycetes bacterium]|jgi:hypothetical protein|nr:hypothetical protein [Planctomycetota bacterium]